MLAVIAEPVRVGVDVAGRAAFYDHDDVYSSMMNGPMVLIFPLVAVLLSCLPLHEQLRAPRREHADPDAGSPTGR